MSEWVHNMPGADRLRLHGWVLSLGFHGAVVAAALLLGQRITFVPPPDPFRWNVAMVEPAPAPPSPTPASEPPTPNAAPAKPAVQPVTPPRPVERRVEERHVQTVKAVEARPLESVEPVVKRTVETVEPVQPADPVVESQPTVQTVQPVQPKVTSVPTPKVASTKMVESEPVTTHEAVEVPTPVPQEPTVTEVAKPQPRQAPVITRPVVDAPSPVAPEPTVTEVKTQSRHEPVASRHVVEAPSPVTPEPTVTEVKTQSRHEPVASRHVVEAPNPVMQEATVTEVTKAVQPIDAPVQHARVEESPSAVTERSSAPVERPSAVVQRPVESTARQETPVVSRQETTQPVREAPTPRTETRPAGEMIAKVPNTAPAPRRDYGWVRDALWRRIVEMKHYPAVARLNRMEGKVVLRAVIKADGNLGDLSIKESSGHRVLDEAAMDVVRRICPVPMKYSLGRPDIVVNIPIDYRLE